MVQTQTGLVWSGCRQHGAGGGESGSDQTGRPESLFRRCCPTFTLTLLLLPPFICRILAPPSLKRSFVFARLLLIVKLLRYNYVTLTIDTAFFKCWINAVNELMSDTITVQFLLKLKLTPPSERKSACDSLQHAYINNINYYLQQCTATVHMLLMVRQKQMVCSEDETCPSPENIHDRLWLISLHLPRLYKKREDITSLYFGRMWACA